MKQATTFFTALLFLLCSLLSPVTQAYVLNRTIADPGSGGGCPKLNHFDTGSPNKTIDRRWNPTLNANLLTLATGSARTDEVEQAIRDSFSVWTAVSSTTLRPASLASLQRIANPTASDCKSTDALNTICFNQSDAGFTSGVLAFTRVVTSDIPGETFGAKTSAFVGEILDADVFFRPADSANFLFATPAALTSNPGAFDLESVLTHELGHFFGFSHSGVWRAMMYPFAPPRGQFLGDRPTTQVPDAPLADDERVGLRVLYPDPIDTLNVGTISGRVLPANPLSLATEPPGVTGIFGAHVVAVDADTGAVIAGTLGGWSCDPMNLPTHFDGSYFLERLPVGRRYKIYVEPLDGPVHSGDVAGATGDLCRVGTNNACTVPPVNTNFVTRTRPQP